MVSDRTIKIYDKYMYWLNQNKSLNQYNLEEKALSNKIFNDFFDNSKEACFAINTNGRWLAIGHSKQNRISIIELKKFKKLDEDIETTHHCYSIEALTDTLIVGEDEKLFIYSFNTLKLLQQINDNKFQKIFSLRASRNEKYLISGGQGFINVYDIKNGF